MTDSPDPWDEGLFDLGPGDIAHLVEQVNNSDILMFHLQTKDIDLLVSRVPTTPLHLSDNALQGERGPQPRVSDTGPSASAVVMRDSHGDSAAKPPAEPTREAVIPVEGAVSVVSPLVGVFYCAPKPGEPPYVAIGQSVQADTTVGLIEAMKVYVAVQAGTSGVVVAIEVEDSQPVEYGQALLWLSPS